MPFQIIDLFFFVVPECQIAGSAPKNSLNLLLNWFVKAISGSNISACKSLLIKSWSEKIFKLYEKKCEQL